MDETEIEHLNNYIIETSEITGVKTTPLTSTGLQTFGRCTGNVILSIRYRMKEIANDGTCKKSFEADVWESQNYDNRAAL